MVSTHIHLANLCVRSANTVQPNPRPYESEAPTASPWATRVAVGDPYESEAPTASPWATRVAVGDPYESEAPTASPWATRVAVGDPRAVGDL